jgi:hypothetical protein
MSSRRRRRPRNPLPDDAAERMDLIRAQADEPTAAAPAAAEPQGDDAADEIAAEMAAVAEEDGDGEDPEAEAAWHAEHPIVDNTPTDGVPAIPDAFTDGDEDDEGPGVIERVMGSQEVSWPRGMTFDEATAQGLVQTAPATRKETDLEEIAREVWTPLGDHEKQNVANFGVGYAQGAADGMVDIAKGASEHWVGHVDPAIPDFEEIFERGPLAAGIRMLESLLVEAKSGYISAQVDQLEQMLDETLSGDERLFLGRVASDSVTASGLPDVAGAYKHLVRARVQAGVD